MGIATGQLASVSVEIGGKEITFETGKLAKQADGAVAREVGRDDGSRDGTGPSGGPRGRGLLPADVDVEERMYAAGKIPGGFFKREGRADRARDPDRAHDRPPDPAALAEGLPQRGAGDLHDAVRRHGHAARHPVHQRRVGGADISPLPFFGPVGAVRIGRIDGELIVNPTLQETEEESSLDLIVVGTPRGADDGRGRRERGARGDAPRGARARARRDPQAVRSAGGAAPQAGKAKWVDTELTEEIEASHGTRSGSASRATASARAGAVVEELIDELAPSSRWTRPRRTSCGACRCARA